VAARVGRNRREAGAEAHARGGLRRAAARHDTMQGMRTAFLAEAGRVDAGVGRNRRETGAARRMNPQVSERGYRRADGAG
jgi:hypothetical protein